MKNRKKKRTMNPKNKTKMSNIERGDYNEVKKMQMRIMLQL